MRPAPIPVISTNSPSREPAVGGCIGERERDRARRRVAVAVDVDDDLLLRDPELARRVVDDPLVRLVRDVDVDVVDGQPALVEHLLRRADHHARRELEDLAAVHLHELVGVLEVARAAARQPEVLAAAAVRAELEAEEAALVDRLDHDRAGAVAEEDERRAVVPVEDLREHVAADDERALREARRRPCVRLRDRVHEAGAAGEQVVGGRVGHPERVGEQRRAGREHHVRRHRRDDDQVDRRRRRRPRRPARRRGRARRCRSAPPPSPRSGARGCRCARRSTRPSCRRTARDPCS